MTVTADPRSKYHADVVVESMAAELARCVRNATENLKAYGVGHIEWEPLKLAATQLAKELGYGGLL